jgi:hypothetical protein
MPINLSSGLDTMVFGLPLIFLLFVCFFRLDSLLTGSRVVRTPRPVRIPVAHQDLITVCTDPDGRPWNQN